MANQMHIDLLRQGKDVLNVWRKQHPKTQLDLYKANLSKANLSGADLSGAVLGSADLSDTDLFKANLSKADLSDAILFRANLIGADLTDADLTFADLSLAYLDNADLSTAIMGWTTIGNIDLRNVKGLETIKHEGPSYVSTSTLERSLGFVPDAFLRGAGLSDSSIKYAQSLRGHSDEYYSCFISHSSKDHEFATRLHADLQQQGVRCWYAPEDLKIGDKFWNRIHESIHRYDKLLIILSTHSVNSNWVEHEVLTALEKERQRNTLVLFPITLDEAVMHTHAPWAADIRLTRHIGDFKRWKEYDVYKQVFAHLLSDLKTDVPLQNRTQK